MAAQHHEHMKTLAHHRDGLLSRADKVPDWMNIKPTSKERPQIILNAILLVLIGFGAYVIQLAAWFNVMYKSFAGMILIFIAALLISLATAVYAHKTKRWLFWGAIFAMKATILGIIVGFLCYYGDLVYYYKYLELRTYTNVGGSQKASSFGDASMFLFTEDTRLDQLRSVGFQSRWTGETYCVSPIVDSTMGPAEDVNYWAIGENCCLNRAEFHCDDATDFTTRSALIVLEPQDVVRPHMRWAVQAAAYPRFERAIKLQEATYNTKAAPETKLVRWTKDPIAFRDGFWSAAIGKCTGWSIAYVVVSSLLAGYIAYVRYIDLCKARMDFAISRN